MKGDFTRFTFDRTKHYTGVLKQQGRVDLDADWNELVAIGSYRDQTEARDVIGACGMPEHNPGFKVGPVTDEGDFSLSTGRAYVDGILCELEKATRYRTQADYPDPPALTPPQEPRTDLVYLDVWQRHVTAIEDPGIREVALGGPDTTTRVQTIWQVKVQEGTSARSCGEIRDWPPAPANGRLTTRTTPVLPPGDPCLINPGSGYTGLENRLYRVEIHQGGELGTDAVSFKWSRDNGSVVFSIEEFVTGEPTKVKVRRLRRDQVLALREQDWVEVLDDATELRGEPGTLVKIDHIDEAKQILTLSQPVSGDADRHPRVRRWDQSSDAIPVTTSAFVQLEDGIEVRFSGSKFQSGDYWVFAARTATRSIVMLEEAPRRGIIHHYCPLALIEWKEGETESEDDAGEPLQIIVLEKAVQVIAEVDEKVSGDREKAIEVMRQRLQEMEASPPEEISRSDYVAAALALKVVARAATLEQARDLIRARLERGDGGSRRGLTPVVRDCRHIFPPLTELRASCCVVTVGDGTTSHGQYISIQEAIDSLPPGGGRVCILSGVHEQETVRIRRRTNVVISGCQPHTWVRSTEAGEPAFRVEESKLVRLENLGFLVSTDTQAIVVRDSLAVEIEHNQVRASAPAADKVQTQPVRKEVSEAPGCETPVGDKVETPLPYAGMIPHRVPGVKIEAASCRRLSICHNQLFGGGIGILSGCDDVVIEGNRIEGGLEHGVFFGMDVTDQAGESLTGVVALVDQPAKAIGTPVDPGEVMVIDKPPEGIGAHVEAGEVDADAIGRLMMPPIRHESDGPTETPSLPSFEPDGFTPAGEVSHVTIRGNVITMMRGSGIAALRRRPNPDALSDLVSVDGLTIGQNDILHCAQDALAEDDGESLLGGIVLAHGRQIHIHDNHIAGCGLLPDAAEVSGETLPESVAPVVGVYVFRSEGLEISHNRIVNNGSAAVGMEGAERQGGVIVEHASIQPIELQVGEEITLAFSDGYPAAKVHGNTVIVPRGQALRIMGIGPMSVTDNQLTSQGTFPPSAASRKKEQELEAQLAAASERANEAARAAAEAEAEVEELRQAAEGAEGAGRERLLAQLSAKEKEAQFLREEAERARAEVDALKAEYKRAQGTTQAPLSLAHLVGVVQIVNLGIADELVEYFQGFLALLMAIRDAGEKRIPYAYRAPVGEIAGELGEQFELVFDGSVLFSDNQVTLNLIRPEKELAFVSVLVVSIDDVAFHDNQLDAVLPPGDKVLANAVVGGLRARASGNVFKETLTRCHFSYLSLALVNMAANNQGNHCFLVKGYFDTVDQPNVSLICGVDRGKFVGQAVRQVEGVIMYVHTEGEGEEISEEDEEAAVAYYKVLRATDAQRDVAVQEFRDIQTVEVQRLTLQKVRLATAVAASDRQVARVRTRISTTRLLDRGLSRVARLGRMP